MKLLSRLAGFIKGCFANCSSGCKTRRILYAAMLGFTASPAMATTYYVSGGAGASTQGSDSNTGTSTSSPFLTIQRAANVVTAGDTVLVMNGTYAPAQLCLTANGQTPINGTASSWITFKAYPGQTPVLRLNGGSNGFYVTSNYIEINGFTIIGDADTITLSQAITSETTGPYSQPCNSGGISIDGRNTFNGGNHHHIRVLNNNTSKCGVGIGMMYCDYLTVQGNTVFDNAYWNQWGSSGISIWEPTAYDQAAGYHMIISQNLVYNNNEFVNNVAANCITDGNGIILDSFNTADPGNNHLAYNPGANGRILVSNNVSAGNGGSGMHALNSKQIDFVNNTTWHNGQRALGPAGWTQGYSGGATIYNGSSTHPNSPSQNGELVINGCSNVNVINNICVADTGRLMNISYNDTNYVYDHNILFGGGDYLWNQGGVYTYLASSYEIPGTNTIEADPLLVNPFITRNTSSTSGISSVAVGNFSLQSGSPAIDSALASYTSPLSVVVTAPSTDILGTVRPQANGDNRGAYEFLAAPSNSTATPTMPPWVLVSLAMLLVTAGLKSLPKPAREN